jgi:hypothetical protein
MTAISDFHVELLISDLAGFFLPGLTDCLGLFGGADVIAWWSEQPDLRTNCSVWDFQETHLKSWLKNLRSLRTKFPFQPYYPQVYMNSINLSMKRKKGRIV